MIPQSFIFQPPRIAVWLVNLFTPGEEAESILGDLFEEFSQLASKSGVTAARSWYWRQTVKTIPHLFGAGLRVAPWSTAVAVVGGFLLMRLISGLPELAIFAVIHRYRLFDHHFDTYVFLATYGIAIGHVIISLLAGSAVALAAKGREMVATTTLALIFGAMFGAAIFALLARGHDSFPLGMLPWNFADWFAIVIGGAIVRTRRSSVPSPG
jgi:hypothetical protein